MLASMPSWAQQTNTGIKTDSTQPADNRHALATLLLSTAVDGSIDAARHTEYLEDRTGSMTLADVRGTAPSAWRLPASSQGDINFGYSLSTYWLRFTVQPGAPDARWRLEISYPTLDSVTVYAPMSDGKQYFATGDRLPYAQRPIDHRHFVFPLNLPTDTPTTIYVRVASQGSLTVPLLLWQDEIFAAHSRTSYAVLFLYYGILLALGLYNLLLFFPLRDPVYLAYVAFAACMAVGQASLNGLANQYLWPDWPAWGDAAFASGTAATGAFGAIFTRMFLATRKHTPLMDRMLILITVAFVVCALMPLVSYRAAAITTSASGSAFSVFAVVAACVCWRRGRAGAKWFLLAFLMLLSGVVLLSLRNFGLIPSNIVTAQGMQIGSAIEMLLLSFALADRITVANVEKKVAQREALQAKEDLVLSMRVSERVLEQRVTERTRALGVANKALERARAELAHQAYYDALTQLPNRLVLQERLSAALVRAAQRGSGFALLWLDLDGFKAINDQHGHAVGDQMLRELAPRMLDAVRASDLVVRFGGDEFVVILENVRSLDVAGRVAELLISRIGLPVELVGLDLAVEVSIGVAIYPDHGSDARTILENADQAMYAAKRAGGSSWCPADPALAASAPARPNKLDIDDSPEPSAH
ncbi:diguanylate cyclase [Pigmentiphaga aceris]|uniref:diguanylate cyclase n=1 Tax=Pigmentiphaga aceris TaxID=1940612 RepID=UPI001652979D|nr:diguanylate cyclase [Pigmentiphaga aceris]